MHLENLTPDECWRLHNKLTDSHIERLLAAGHAVDMVSSIKAHLQEAKAGTFSESFLSPQLDALQGQIHALGESIKASRGVARERLETVKQGLEDVMKQITQARDDALNAEEYRIEEVRQALNIINGLA